MSDANKSLHREFELERLILFSDAVFAIAITLLIIEVKFPELPKDALQDMGKALHPLIGQVLAFVISFFFIGNFWMRHLHFCKMLKSYNDTLIKLNLFFLFFIVTFPFCATMIAEHAADMPLLSLCIYVGNIICCSVTYLIMMYYVLRINRSLVNEENKEAQEKMFADSKYYNLSFLIMIVTTLLTAIISHGNARSIILSALIFPVLLRMRNRWVIVKRLRGMYLRKRPPAKDLAPALPTDGEVASPPPKENNQV